jgi:uncharacterized protein YhfF
LNDLVLSGAKKATAGRIAEYEADGEELEQPGERLVLLDDDLHRVGLVQVDRVEVVPFGDVPWEFAAAENEGDRSIEEWREGHRRYWREATASTVPTMRRLSWYRCTSFPSRDEFFNPKRSTGKQDISRKAPAWLTTQLKSVG